MREQGYPHLLSPAGRRPVLWYRNLVGVQGRCSDNEKDENCPFLSTARKPLNRKHLSMSKIPSSQLVTPCNKLLLTRLVHCGGIPTHRLQAPSVSPEGNKDASNSVTNIGIAEEFPSGDPSPPRNYTPFQLVVVDIGACV